MSKYYKAEDIFQVIDKIMQNATETDAEAIIDIDLAIEINKLPTIEVSEDCISREWVLEEYQKGKELLSKSEYFDELMWLVKHAPSVVPKAITTVDTLLIATALWELAQDSERNVFDRKRAEELRERVLAYGASMCHQYYEPQGDDIVVRSNLYPFKVAEPDGEKIE